MIILINLISLEIFSRAIALEYQTSMGAGVIGICIWWSEICEAILTKPQSILRYIDHICLIGGTTLTRI
jgi:hypothetical protein